MIFAKFLIDELRRVTRDENPVGAVFVYPKMGMK